MTKQLSRLLPFVFLVLLCTGPLRAEPAAALKFPGEQRAWEQIAARFDGAPIAKPDGAKTTEVSVTGLKADPKAAAATASVRIDNATGHVVAVTSNGAKFTDDEFAIFTGFPELTALTLWHNSGGFTGTGAAHLATLPKLERLTLAGGGLNDAGMAAAAKLTNLHELRAWHCRFTDAGVAALRKHPSLESISIGPSWESTITDKSLEPLADCPKLHKLTITETWLTWDGGLKHLPKLNGTLTDLDLGICLIEPADVERLRKELPNTKIIWKGLAGAGADFAKPYQRQKASKWIPKDLIDRAIAEAAKNPPASEKH